MFTWDAPIVFFKIPCQDSIILLLLAIPIQIKLIFLASVSLRSVLFFLTLFFSWPYFCQHFFCRPFFYSNLIFTYPDFCHSEFFIRIATNYSTPLWCERNARSCQELSGTYASRFSGSWPPVYDCSWPESVYQFDGYESQSFMVVNLDRG